MQRIDFFALERVVQDRLVAAARGGYSPKLLGAAPLPLRLASLQVVAAAGASFVLLFAPLVGWGSLGSSLGRQGFVFFALYALAASTLAAVGAIVAVRMHARATAPVAPGVYMFPGVLIEADGDELRCHRLAHLQELSVVGALVRLRYAHASLSFSCDDAQSAEAMAAELTNARALLASGKLEPELSDPLTAPKFASPVGPVGAHHRTASFWRGLGLGLAIAMGIGCSLLLWWGRNYQSDEAMYAAARAQDTQPAYEAYLVSGQRHADEVRTLDLPRVSTVRAESLQFKIASAKVAGDAPKLRSLIARGGTPQGLHAPLQCTATAADPDPCAPLLVASALSEIADERIRVHIAPAPKSDPAEAVTWAGLIRRATMMGGALRVSVSHGRIDHVALARSDKYLGQSTLFMGEVSRLSKHFDELDEIARDARDQEALIKALRLRFEPIELQVLGGASEPSDAGRLEIKRTNAWSGRVYSARSPRGVFLGMTYGFELHLQAGGSAPFVRKVTQMVGVETPWMAGASNDPTDTNARAIAEYVYSEQSALATSRAYGSLLASLVPHRTPLAVP